MTSDIPPPPPPNPTHKPYTVLGRPHKRKTQEESAIIHFPSESKAERRVRNYDLDSFLQPFKMISSAISTVEETGFSHLVRLIHIFTSFQRTFPLQLQDKVDLQTTKEFFLDLYSIIQDGSLDNISKTYAVYDVEFVQALTAEVLAKVIVYRENIDGCEIALPIYHNQQWQLCRYMIKEHVVGNNLPVLLLKCDHENIANWIIPRGTSPYLGIRKGAFESIQADFFHEEGIDLFPIQSNQEEIAAIVQNLTTSNNPLLIAGHSLGGVFSIKIAMDYPGQTEAVYTFGSPGVCNHLKSEYDSLEMKPKIFQFLTEGDIVPSAGKHLVGKVFAITVENFRKKLPVYPFAEHVCLVLNQNHSFVEVDVEKEQKTLTRHVMETVIRSSIIGGLIRLTKKD